MTDPVPPTLDELGRDLLRIPRWRLVLSLASPFVLVGLFFAFASSDWWLAAGACMVALSFITYGSISHDLVHRTLSLSRRWNDLFLTLIEGLMLRSGRAYRLAHLNHHARYPDPVNDPEARAAYVTLGAALLSGPGFFVRLWWWAVRNHPEHRARLATEGLAILCLATVAVLCAVMGWTFALIVYVGLAYLGTWIVPVATAYIPHAPMGATVLSQTRRFRGWIIRLLAFDHLYHLEHHLYPAIPHQRWPELARRLDAFLDQAAVPAIRLKALFRGRHV
jgi:beta-carotene hydroxylase